MYISLTLHFSNNLGNSQNFSLNSIMQRDSDDWKNWKRNVMDKYSDKVWLDERWLKDRDEFFAKNGNGWWLFVSKEGRPRGHKYSNDSEK